VCCIDPLCLDETDYSAVRLVIKLLDSPDAPPLLFVRHAATGSSTEVRIRIVRAWP
jgi:hypothetical protein